MIGIVTDETDASLLKFVFRDGTGTTKDLVDGSGAKYRPSTPVAGAVTNDTLDLIIEFYFEQNNLKNDKRIN